MLPREKEGRVNRQVLSERKGNSWSSKQQAGCLKVFRERGCK